MNFQNFAYPTDTLLKLAAVILPLFLGLSAEAGTVKIMSYNVLANWDRVRGDRIVAVVKDQAPDVLGFQEVVGGNTEYLLSELDGGFEAYFAATADPVFVRRDADLRMIENGTAELVKCLIDRQVNWVRLEDRISGEQFVYYNTHLCFILENTLEDYTNEEANQIQASQIIDVMASHAEDGLVQVLGGDLNVFSSSNTTKFFLEGQPLPVNGKKNPLVLKETWASAPGNAGERPITVVRDGNIGGQQGQGGGRRRRGGIGRRIEMPNEPGIDWLFVSESANVIAAEVIQNELTVGTSDHLPISVTIAF